VILFMACKKENINNPQFKWVKNQDIFHYDDYTITGVEKDFRILQIFNTGNNEYFFGEIPDTTQRQYFSETLYGSYLIDNDGLHKSRAATCGLESFFSIDALFMPNNPVTDQVVPVYSCGNELDYNLKILAADKIISVPYGTFKTYIMQFKNGDKGYIDPNNGLIMYVAIDSLKKTTDTLKLSFVTKQ
jgi:hypothetical protein